VAQGQSFLLRTATLPSKGSEGVNEETKYLTREFAAHRLAEDMETIHFAGVAETVENVRAKEISPVEIVEAHLLRVETLQPS